MAPVAKKTSSRAKQFASFDEKPVKDFDPEADGPTDDAASNDSDEEEEDVGGTEHYVSVGKSKLRQKEPPALGPKYSGIRVSRAALDDSSDGESGQDGESDDDDDDASDEDGSEEEFDDPDLADLERDNIIDDEEIDSDDALAEGEEEMFKKKGFTFKDSKSNVNKAAPSASADKKAKVLANGRPRRMVAADLMSGSESEEEESAVEDGSNDSDEEEDIGGSGSEEDGTGEGSSDDDHSSEDDESEEDEDEDEDEEMEDADATNDRSSLRNLVQDDQKGVISNISQAAKADAEKGVAVRQQRRTYDSLLNLRIRLQKGLVAINSLNQVTDSDDNDDKQPYEAAEEAAIKLWNAIDRFRASLLPEPKAGQKRKRDTQTIDASLDEIWQDMQADEERATAKRNKILTKWSTKVKSSTATISKERHLGATASDSLIGALETQLLNPERLIKRTQVPRSCAPLQASKKVADDPTIYDDADFYQLLLKELVDQRTNDADGDADGNVPTVRWTAVKEAKTRKQVDRRASKGRKLRFTVHEKLQNFMAPEDRKSWEEEAIDRLFGTLFGQRMQLKEDVSDEEDDDMVLAEEGLKLFRN